AERTWIHAFTDGRDVSPTSAVHELAELPDDRIATISGRYYAMDRDKRWERTQLTLDAIFHAGPGARREDTAVALVQRSYEGDVTDEFIVPFWREGQPALHPKRDAAICFNFRPDRMRQLAGKLGELGLDVTTMTQYSEDFDFPIAFPGQHVDQVLAEVLAEAGVRQLHMAETEKYAHVTYFFNGGREDEFPGETRMLVPSPRDVPSYDHKPEMSAVALADAFVGTIGDGYGFAVVNFANPDMVGHSGVIPAAVAAVETADACLGRVVEAVTALGGVCLVTADHGNAEQMLEDDGVSPMTAHTTNLVPLLLTEKGLKLREHGELSDLAPTILALLGFARPLQMSGENLIENS
ncbi:MAG: 2,3-bisphosphoglycerate-independent phosphoglycerate mutase, partial [Actinomycetota bacterium]